MSSPPFAFDARVGGRCFTFFLSRQTSSFESLVFMDVRANSGCAMTVSQATALPTRAEEKRVTVVCLWGTRRPQRETILIGVWWMHTFQTPCRTTP